jgi:uncharacterized membrane protein YkoI
MRTACRFATAALTAAALILALAPMRAEEAEHTCLNQKERRVEAESGRLISLGRAMHAARVHLPGTVVQARLCRAPEGLVYVLTVLAHDGRVERIAVDAVKGTLVGGL